MKGIAFTTSSGPAVEKGASTVTSEPAVETGVETGASGGVASSTLGAVWELGEALHLLRWELGELGVTEAMALAAADQVATSTQPMELRPWQLQPVATAATMDFVAMAARVASRKRKGEKRRRKEERARKKEEKKRKKDDKRRKKEEKLTKDPIAGELQAGQTATEQTTKGQIAGEPSALQPATEKLTKDAWTQTIVTCSPRQAVCDLAGHLPRQPGRPPPVHLRQPRPKRPPIG